MNNLFLIFDPYLSKLNNLSWIFVFFLINPIYWKLQSLNSFSYLYVFKKLNLEFFNINYPLNTPGISFFMINFFGMIALLNLISLFPYIFPLTTHCYFPLMVMVPIWIGQFTYSWLFFSHSNLIHLTPKNTPMALTPLMILIELLSNMIRPITLSVRLMANISAGHLLISISCSSMSIFSLTLNFSILIFCSILMILEIAVALIQAYVFSLLMTMFVKEVNQ